MDCSPESWKMRQKSLFPRTSEVDLFDGCRCDHHALVQHAGRKGAEMGAMKMRNTCLHVHGGRGNTATEDRVGWSGYKRTPSEAGQKICVFSRIFGIGVIGLALLLSTPSASLANSGNAAGTVGSGIRNPLNPQAYMRELARKLNTDKQREELLHGVSTGDEDEDTTPSVPTTRLPRPQRPMMQPPATRQPAPAQASRQTPDLRQLIADEIERQEREDAQQQRLLEEARLREQAIQAERTRQQEQLRQRDQARVEEEQLRQMIADEVKRLRATQPGPAAQDMVAETPQTREPAVTEQDLRDMIARELSRQGVAAPTASPVPVEPEPVVEEPAEPGQDLQALLAREMQERRGEQLTTIEPEPEAPVQTSTPADDEVDLQTLIARELDRQQQQNTEAATPEPVTTAEPAAMTETAPAAEDDGRDAMPVLTEEQVRQIIAQELSRQNPAPVREPAPTAVTPTEPAVRTQPEPAPARESDLQALIAQELERRRQEPQPTSSNNSAISVTGLSANNQAANRAYRDIQIQKGLIDPDEPWSLGSDLEKYRAYAVAQGSRDSIESLTKALSQVGLTLEDGANILTLGYASDRGKPFRVNDGKGLFQEPGNVPRQAGKTLSSLGDGLYSIVDLALLDSLGNVKNNAYQDNHPLVRPLVFTGRTVGGLWRTTEELGNAVTWGYFDNLTGPIGMCFTDIIEVVKHTGQAVTNVVRAPLHLLGGKDSKADKALDWVLLVPLEMASNMVEMQGFSNMDDYETAFADKGVIGSIIEFGGSSYIVYRAVDELDDELNDDNGSQDAPSSPSEPSTPGTPDVPSGPPADGVLYFPLQ